MRETTNKYKLPVHFSKVKVASYPLCHHILLKCTYYHTRYSRSCSTNSLIIYSNLPPFTSFYLQSWSKNAPKKLNQKNWTQCLWHLERLRPYTVWPGNLDPHTMDWRKFSLSPEIIPDKARINIVFLMSFGRRAILEWSLLSYTWTESELSIFK